MSIFLYWGEDEFALEKAVKTLTDSSLDPNWSSFNYDKISPDQTDAVIQALNQAMTPAFGFGSRLVWLVNTTICQQCSDQLLRELERTLPNIPDSTVLLLTTPNKPDGRLKSTKLLQKYAQFKEFAVIPPWKTELLIQRVQEIATEKQVKITTRATETLAQAVGNDTRLLYNELEKLALYTQKEIIDVNEVNAVVTCSTQNSLQLASAIREGNTVVALGLVSDLINNNEPALRIVATLTGQFRTWLWLKIMIESGAKDDQIAQSLEIANPKRIYFLRQEVKSLQTKHLTATLPLMLELEFSLKRGAESLSTCQTKVIELCQIFQQSQA